MRTCKCKETTCNRRMSRIKRGLDGVGAKNIVDLSVKTVTIDGDVDCKARAVEILDDPGFTAVGV